MLGTLPAETTQNSDDHVASFRDDSLRSLESAELRAVATTLERLGISSDDCIRAATQISEPPRTQQYFQDLHAAVIGRAPELAGTLERFVLAHAALRSAERLETASIAPDVKQLWCKGLLRYASGRAAIRFPHQRFIGLCKIATLRRFPAGQFDWEPSGLPRTWVPRVRPLSALVRLLSLVAFDWRGFKPAFYVHLTVMQPVYALLEGEVEKAYYRMARSMELQPEIKGLIASSWLHSPDTFRVTPHLAWLNRVYLENGGLVATMGPAGVDCGVLHRSPERQRAYEEGRFTPTLGLVIWPRAEMLAWADRHPELGA